MRPLLTLGLVYLALFHSFAQPPEKMDLSPSFNLLSDSGSICSITLLVQKAWNPLSGHAFLELTKSHGPDSVVRYVGFDRQNPKQILFSDAPVPSKLTDDAFHAYHGSLRRRITPAELRAVLQELKQLSASRYQTFRFNSVDFALRVMACLPLSRPLSLTPHSATTGRLYRLLKEREQNPADTAETIFIARRLQYAGGGQTPATFSAILHHP